MSSKKSACYSHFYKVNPTHSVSFFRSNDDKPPTRTPFSKQLRKCNAQLSPKAKANLRNCFNWLRLISNKKLVYSKAENKRFYFKLNFITLTLSDTQMHSDEYIKSHMLEPFLKWLMRSWNVNSYIWKAEVQNNGNIHFHITTNKFVHWKSVRAKWNRLLSKHGYCKVFQDGTNDKGNAATEVKAVKNEKDITNYMVNYISKKDLFKQEWKPHSKKKHFINSETCTINNHYYQRENFRQVQCGSGEVREYKRQVHGRIWSASYNLNESALVINETMKCYHELDRSMHLEKYTKTISSRIVKTPEGEQVVFFDWYKIHIHQQKDFFFLPTKVHYELDRKIKALIEADQPQYKVTVPTLF